MQGQYRIRLLLPLLSWLFVGREMVEPWRSRRASGLVLREAGRLGMC